ncbi:MAG: hypothetical protein NC332_03460, partial [Firmicutes bacterium]|nr:hypothetical protein [Bacillota bacterium]
MQVVKLSEKLNCPLVVCLGYFGCMHKGHVALVDKAKRRACERGAATALFTFSNDHLKVLGKGGASLYSFYERLSLYESAGVDFVINCEFDESFRALSGEEFLSALLKFDLRGIVCGFDYCCGSDRMDCFALKEYFADKVLVDIVDRVSIGSEKISTSMIKRLLAEHKIEDADRLLSEPYFISGKVVSGRGVGRELGFPTANVEVFPDKLLPVGVYGGTSVIDGLEYKCIVNVGQIPTFGITST